MPAYRPLFAISVLFASCVAFACSCSNSVPIQKTSERYTNRAVFTARVVQLMGRVYDFRGKRMSGQVLAIVKQQYWGLPWYWPRIVVLDGGFFCNIVMEQGKDYLVSGHRVRYGVLDVSGCSRTQPVDEAQVDVRTLDGSHCAGPGGTVIGHVYRGEESYRQNPPVPDLTLTFRDQFGQPHTVKSGNDGIFELPHIPVGPYTLDSHFSSSEYVAGGGFTVREGVCGEADVLLSNYQLYGKFVPGLGGVIKLLAVGSSQVWQSGYAQSDGMFYFRNIPDGEYLLAVESMLNGQGNDFYYPGTFDRRRGKTIKIADHKVSGSNQFDFDQSRIPYVPIRVALDIAKNSGFSWRVLLATSDNILGEERWAPEAKFTVVYGLRGQPYTVRLWGDPDHRTKQDICQFDVAHIIALPGLDVLHGVLPPECR